MIRLNKYLSEAGICSRREADRLIQEGRVTVDGQTAQVGMQIRDGQAVAVDGQEVRKKAGDKFTLIAVNKPRGIVC